jgi:hypothetical protein
MMMIAALTKPDWTIRSRSAQIRRNGDRGL